jgi:hypothetical protein
MKRIRRTTESFIVEANNIHGNEYDYSRVEYTRIDQKVSILCKKHGQFEQTPHTHLVYKSGCPDCAQDRNGDNTEIFISKAKVIHGDKYDYSQVEYKNNSTKVKIICSEHGIFEQIPANHTTKSSGCPRCAHRKRGEVNTRTTDDFISEAKVIHGDKYDYSKSVYETIHTKLEIICPTHGSFQQQPSNHLHAKHGCPQCAVYGCYTGHFFKVHPEMKAIPALLYFIEFNKGGESFQKIGITKRTLEERFNSNKGYHITSLHVQPMELYSAFLLEQQIISNWSDFKYTPNDKIGGDTECFKLSPPKVRKFISEIALF